MRSLITTLLLVIPTLLAGQAYAADSISVDELARQLDAGTAPPVIDVRTPQEYVAGHVPGARLIPHDRMGDHVGELADLKDELIVLYCHSGPRANRAAKVLEDRGFQRVILLDGSYQAWSGAGKPIAR